jgi:hypothetical protein
MVNNQVKLPGFRRKWNEIYSFRSFNCWISPVATCGGVRPGFPISKLRYPQQSAGI